MNLTLMNLELKHFKVTKTSNVITVEIDCQNSSANALNRKVLSELNSILDDLKQKNFDLLVFKSAKSTFVVGADVNEIYELAKTKDITKLSDFIKYGQDVFNKISDFPKATCAVINGTAMGGGLELALACDYRIVYDNDSIQLALPETKLGILPAWGGTTRLPRIIGADNAIDLICSGRSLRPKQALKLGLVDSVVQEDKLDLSNLPTNFEQVRKLKNGPLKLNMIEAMMVFRGVEGIVKKNAGSDYPAPLKALDVIKESRKLNRNDALELELSAAIELSQEEVTENLISLFLKEQKIKAKARFISHETKTPESVLVLGAGTMGKDIAYLTANKGVLTYVYDNNQDSANKAIATAKDYLMDKIKKNFIDINEMTDVLQRMIPSLPEEEVDLAIEAIYENFDAKVDLIKKIDKSKVFLSNTSTISIEALQKATDKNVCGMHFFNPVKKMPLVEVIRGPNTPDEVVAATVGFALKLGKTPIIVNDCPGFVVNRLLFPYLMAFDRLVSEGYNFVDIDKMMHDWGWPMGPATLCDLVGLDIVYHAGRIMGESYGWKFHENSLIESLVTKGDFGQKTGKGFYSWKEKKGKMVNNGTNITPSDAQPITEEVVDELMNPMCQEANRILKEAVVNSWDEIDLALIMGAGFPPFRGGLSKLAGDLS